MRGVLAVIAGLLAGIIIIMFGEMFSHFLFPPSRPIDFNDKETVKNLMQHMPLIAWIMVLLSWSFGAFGGGIVATLVANEKKQRLAIIVGVILMLVGIINMLRIVSPLWFWIVGLLIFIPSAWMGNKLIEKRDIFK